MRLTSELPGRNKALRLISFLLVTGILSIALADSVVYYATYKLDGGTANTSSQRYTASGTDTSAVWVTNSGSLTLANPTISTTGNTSSQDNSSFYGLNAGLLATAAGKATVTGGSITTTGTGANGAFATGTGSSVSLTNTTIAASADGAHAVMATQGGTLTLNNVNMTTSGGSASAVATDRGGGTITVAGGSITVGGGNSACIYSTGSITLSGVTCKANGAEAAVIEGANSITLANTSLTVADPKWGAMIYQSMSGDATGSQGIFTMSGGAFDYMPGSGPLFYVNNTTAVITLQGVTVTAGSGVLIKAAAGNWGTSGSNGGTVMFTGDGQTLVGDMMADNISSITATLKNSSTLKGTLTKAGLSLDSSSVWNVTGNSTLTTLADSAGIVGASISNINGNGYSVTYDASLPANSYLNGLTYSLAGGGTLAPSGSSGGSSSCTYNLASSSQSFTSAAGTGTVTVTASANTCAWTAASDASWITITSGASGTGSGSVGYSVTANSTSSQRTGTLTIGGKTFTVTQAAGSGTGTGGPGSGPGSGPGAFMLNPNLVNETASGGSVKVMVVASSTASSTAWTAVSNAAWITVTSGAAGTGNGTVILTVADNSSSTPRTGTVTIAGLPFTVAQAGAAGGPGNPGSPGGRPGAGPGGPGR